MAIGFDRAGGDARALRDLLDGPGRGGPRDVDVGQHGAALANGTIGAITGRGKSGGDLEDVYITPAGAGREARPLCATDARVDRALIVSTMIQSFVTRSAATVIAM